MNYKHAENSKGESICVICQKPLNRHSRCKKCMALTHVESMRDRASKAKYADLFDETLIEEGSRICNYCINKKPVVLNQL